MVEAAVAYSCAPEGEAAEAVYFKQFAPAVRAYLAGKDATPAPTEAAKERSVVGKVEDAKPGQRFAPFGKSGERAAQQTAGELNAGEIRGWSWSIDPKDHPDEWAVIDTAPAKDAPQPAPAQAAPVEPQGEPFGYLAIGDNGCVAHYTADELREAFADDNGPDGALYECRRGSEARVKVTPREPLVEIEAVEPEVKS